MIANTRYVFWQTWSGMLAMLLFAGALLSLADALRGGLGGSNGLIELLPNSRYQISGPMPPRTEAIKDFIIDGLPADGSVRLVPEDMFSGYWLGGSMWRGVIVVESFAREQNLVLSIKDRFGEKQNPALVFTVCIWPDLAMLHSHSASWLTRRTGQSPYFFAGSLTLCGAIAALLNYLLGGLLARQRATCNCGVIFNVRKTAQGTEITSELRYAHVVQAGAEGAVYRPSGEKLCSAHVLHYKNNELCMIVHEAGIVRLGDVACLVLENAAIHSSSPL